MVEIQAYVAQEGGNSRLGVPRGKRNQFVQNRTYHHDSWICWSLDGRECAAGRVLALRFRYSDEVEGARGGIGHSCEAL